MRMVVAAMVSVEGQSKNDKRARYAGSKCERNPTLPSYRERADALTQLSQISGKRHSLVRYRSIAD